MPTWRVLYERFIEYRVDAETEEQAKAAVELHWHYSADLGVNVRILDEATTVDASLITEKEGDVPCPPA